MSNNYVVVNSEFLDDLQTKINEKLAEGYVLVGGMTTGLVQDDFEYCLYNGGLI